MRRYKDRKGQFPAKFKNDQKVTIAYSKLSVVNETTPERYNSMSLTAPLPTHKVTSCLISSIKLSQYGKAEQLESEMAKVLCTPVSIILQSSKLP